MLAILILGAVYAPKLAVVSRFYYPYPDKRLSYRRLYTVDWNGGNLKLISSPGQDCEEVMWVGRQRLVYSVLVKSEPHITSIWTVKLSDGKPTLLAKKGYLDKDAAFESSKDGVPVVHIDRNRPQTVSLTSGRLLPISPKSNGWYDPFQGTDGVFVAKAVQSTDRANPGSFTVNDKNEAELITSKGRESLKNPVLFGIHEPKSNRLWIIDYPSMHSERLHRVRWETGKVQELFWAGYTLDWRPDRERVAYSTQRNLSQYGPKKTVWTNELWVGNLDSGMQHQIKLPMAFYADIAVSPMR